MPIQTSVSFTHTKRLKGQRSYLFNSEERTAYADIDIEFGVGLMYAAEAPDGRVKVKMPAANTETFVGVSVLTHLAPTGEPVSMTTVTTTQLAKYAAKYPITLKTKGVIVVYAEQAVDPSLPVFLRYTANASLVPGDFRVDADTSRALQLTRASWVEKTSAAGLTLLKLDY